MWHFAVAALIGPVMIFLLRFRVIPKLEDTVICVALGFALGSIGLDSFLDFAKMLALCCASYWVVTLLYIALQRDASMKEVFLFSFLYSVQAAFFSFLLGGFMFFVAGLFS